MNGFETHLFELRAGFNYCQIEPDMELAGLRRRRQCVNFQKLPENPLEVLDAVRSDFHVHRLGTCGLQITQPRIIVKLHRPA